MKKEKLTKRPQKHTIKLESNSAGSTWVCSCGKVWAYGMHNVNAVNAHTGRLSR